MTVANPVDRSPLLASHSVLVPTDLEDQPQQVFVLGDIHGNVGFLWYAAREAAALGCSTILQLGDFGALWPGSNSFLPTVDDLLSEAGVERLVFIDGNHEGFTSEVPFPDRRGSAVKGGLVAAAELADRDADGFCKLSERVAWISRGHRWQWNGVRFGAIGGAFSVDWRHRTPGFTWWPDLEVPSPAEVDRLGSEPLDVLVLHDAPAGVPLERVSTFTLSESDQRRAQQPREFLRAAVELTRPQIVLHGHWHWRHGTRLAWSDETDERRATRVEGLGADLDGDVDWASGVLDLRGGGPTFPTGPPIPESA